MTTTLDTVNLETFTALNSLLEEYGFSGSTPTFEDCKNAEAFTEGQKVKAKYINQYGVIDNQHYRVYDGLPKFHLSVVFDDGSQGSWPPEDLKVC